MSVAIGDADGEAAPPPPTCSFSIYLQHTSSARPRCIADKTLGKFFVLKLGLKEVYLLVLEFYTPPTIFLSFALELLVARDRNI